MHAISMLGNACIQLCVQGQGNQAAHASGSRDSSEGAQARIALLQRQAHLIDELERCNLKEKTSVDSHEIKEATQGVERARALILDAVAVIVEPTKTTRDRHQAAGGACWKTSTILPDMEQVNIRLTLRRHGLVIMEVINLITMRDQPNYRADES